VDLLLALLMLAALALVAGAVYQALGRASDKRRFPPPGRLVDAGGGRLHVDARGEGAPVVVFEAGIAATSLSWRLVQPEVARLTRTVSYDRAWLGWSEPILKPRNIWQVVEELRALLDRAGLGGPRILVAHSYGALVALAYAARYPAEVCGMVLVDPVAASEWAEPSASRRKMLRRGILLSRRGRLLASLGIVRATLSLLAGGARRLPKLVARVSSGRGAVFTEQIANQIRKLPHAVWPMIQSHWCDPKCFEGMARYLEALPESATVVASTDVYPVPLTVLSAGNATAADRAEHQRLARCSLQGRNEIVMDSGHWIQLDRPEIVIQAISEMVMQSRL